MAGSTRAGGPIEGIMRWGTGGRWADAWEDTLVDHLGEVLETHGQDLDELPDLLGKDAFANLMGAVFEDFLATRFDEREPDNVVDDYLKRRGWKESAATRRYLEALRDAAIGLYEVTDKASGEWFEVKDMLGGTPPMRVFDRLAARTVTPGDRLALRLIEQGDRLAMSGAVLVYAEAAVRELTDELELRIEEAMAGVRQVAADEVVDDPDLAEALVREVVLMESGPLFTDVWLAHTLDALGKPALTDFGLPGGTDLVVTTTSFPLLGDDPTGIVGRLDDAVELRREDPDAQVWTWLGEESAADPDLLSDVLGVDLTGLTEGGQRLLGSIRLGDGTLDLETLSPARAERGTTFLQTLLPNLLGPPTTTTRPLIPGTTEEEGGGLLH